MSVVKLPLPDTSIVNEEPSQVRITNTGTAMSLVHDFDVIINLMLELLNQETNMLRQKHLYEASRLKERKLWLINTYDRAIKIFNNNSVTIKRLIPNELMQLNHKHGLLKANLERNNRLFADAIELYTEMLKQAFTEIDSGDKKIYNKQALFEADSKQMTGNLYNRHL